MIIYTAIIAILILTIALFWISRRWLKKFTTRAWLLNGGGLLAVITTYAVLLFDQLPFYWYAKYLYSKDGGVMVEKLAPEQQGYMALGNCEVRTDTPPFTTFDVLCYFELFDSPNRTRALKFIEFELDADQAKQRSTFYQREGPGVYRISLENKSLSDCPVLQDLQERLSRFDPRFIENGPGSRSALLQQAKDTGKCPVVRKVDAPLSQYRQGGTLRSTVVYSDGVHKIIRSDRRDWETLVGSSSLYRHINYCVRGAIILWGGRSDVWPPDPCVGDERSPNGISDPFNLYR